MANFSVANCDNLLHKGNPSYTFCCQQMFRVATLTFVALHNKLSTQVVIGETAHSNSHATEQYCVTSSSKILQLLGLYTFDRAVTKGWGPGISPTYYEHDLSGYFRRKQKENRTKRTSTLFILKLYMCI